MNLATLAIGLTRRCVARQNRRGRNFWAVLKWIVLQELPQMLLEFPGPGQLELTPLASCESGLLLSRHLPGRNQRRVFCLSETVVAGVLQSQVVPFARRIYRLMYGLGHMELLKTTSSRSSAETREWTRGPFRSKDLMLFDHFHTRSKKRVAEGAKIRL